MSARTPVAHRAPSPHMVRRAAGLLMHAHARPVNSLPRPTALPPLRRPELHETPLSLAEINFAIARGLCSSRVFA